jgi:hypothetical protein
VSGDSQELPLRIVDQAGELVSAVPQAAIDAVAVWLHDDRNDGCNDGDTSVCGRWKSGSDPGDRFHSLHAGHVEFYREAATCPRSG